MFSTPSVRTRRGWQGVQRQDRNKAIKPNAYTLRQMVQCVYIGVAWNYRRFVIVPAFAVLSVCFSSVYAFHSTPPLLQRRARQQGGWGDWGGRDDRGGSNSNAAPVIVTVIAFKPFVKLRHDSWQLLCQEAITCHKAFEISCDRQRGGVGQVIFQCDRCHQCRLALLLLLRLRLL